MGAGAIVAVGQGSKTPSRMIILEYPGTKKNEADRSGGESHHIRLRRLFD